MMDHNEYNLYLDRKLAHYNVWLVDNSRAAGKPYPGFPEDKQVRPVKVRMKNMQVMNAFEQHDHDMAQRKVATPKAERAPAVAKEPRAPRATGPTKSDRALEIFKRLSGDKACLLYTSPSPRDRG